jgi:glycosyltransferase involved in cell wall biosynthesis
LRVVVVSPTQPGSLGLSLARGLRDAGHDAVVLSRPSLVAGNRLLISIRRLGLDALTAGALGRSAVRSIARCEPDAIVIIKGRFVTDSMVERIRQQLRIPIVNYYPDDPFWPGFHEESVVRALRSYDLVCIWSPVLEQKLRDARIAATMVLPFAYDPADYPPRPEGYPYRYDAAFVGQWYPVRERFLTGLADLRLIISGLGWAQATRGTPLARHVVPGDHFAHGAAELYWSSKVGINILHEVNARAGHNMRSWELPATGTATVATRTRCHERMYGGGAMLVSSPEELSAGVRNLLENDTRRAMLASAGAEAVRDGTYVARAHSLVAAIRDLCGAGRP